MPLPLPDLDTRRWTDLVEEARAMIPRYAPTWTDHNIHDPGITLIELLAWLVEMDVYRLNRVPDTHRRKFLALVGIKPQPPQAARALLSLAPSAPTDVPDGAEFLATNTDGSGYLFCARSPLHAVSSQLTTLLVQSDPGTVPQEQTTILQEQGVIAPLGDVPITGAALWLGFDSPFPKQEPVQIAFVFASRCSGDKERQRILEEATAQQEAYRHPLQPSQLFPAAHPLEHHSARLVWEFYGAAEAWRALDPSADEVRDDTRAFTLDGAVWFSLPDEMAALDVGTGTPRYYLRARLATGEYDTPPLLAGILVNALPLEQAAPVSQTYLIQAGVVADGVAPAIPGKTRLKLQLNALGAITALAFSNDPTVPEVAVLYYQSANATAPGALILELILVGRSDGTASQVFSLPQKSVQGGSLDLYSLDPQDALPAESTWQLWQVQPDFDASNGHDAHILLDETTARITFGDGNHGRIPPIGTPLLARYRATAAADGTVRPGHMVSLAPTLRNWLLWNTADFQSKVSVLGLNALLAADRTNIWQEKGKDSYTNTTKGWASNAQGAIAIIRPIADGAAAETTLQAAGRAIATIQTPTRAITASDYEVLASATPGTAIARVHTLTGHHPSYPCLVAPGIVTVIIVPSQRREKPTPSPGLLTAVRRYLNRRRILGSHLEVVGPSYVLVQVSAQVQALPGASRQQVQKDVVAALNRFLDPLAGGPASIPLPSRSSQQIASTLSPAAPASVVPGAILLTQAASPPATPLQAPTLAPGWPFGRGVYRTEVLQVINGVPGVESVQDLELTSESGLPQCGNLCVGPTELVVPGPHTIEVK